MSKPFRQWILFAAVLLVVGVMVSAMTASLGVTAETVRHEVRMPVDFTVLPVVLPDGSESPAMPPEDPLSQQKRSLWWLSMNLPVRRNLFLLLLPRQRQESPSLLRNPRPELPVLRPKSQLRVGKLPLFQRAKAVCRASLWQRQIGDSFWKFAQIGQWATPLT